MFVAGIGAEVTNFVGVPNSGLGETLISQWGK
jgi:hypothetical protein